MTCIDPNSVSFVRATKTKAILARSLQTLVNDADFVSKLLLQTLEGTQALGDDSMVCIGLTMSDPWQQTPAKLLAKYTVTDIRNGWLYCEPKPDNETDVCQITQEMVDGDAFFINAQWGEKQANGSFIQKGFVGDYLCRKIDDEADVWLVRRSFFDQTYDFK